MYTIKQNTAETVPVFAHDVNGDPVTGLTNASFTKRISKGSGAFAAMTVTLVEKENGWYDLPLSATHSNTLGLLTITLTNAGAKQINLQFRVEAKLVDTLNDIAVTAIVSSGAITTLAGAVVNVDTCDVNTDMVAAPDNASVAQILIDTTALVGQIVTALGEPAQGIPPEVAALSVKISYLYKNLINKADQTSTGHNVYNYAATVVDHKSADSSDGVLATKGNLVAGP